MSISQLTLFPSSRRLCHLALPGMLGMLLCQPAWGQAHTAASDRHMVRASTVGSMDISASTAQEHGIERSDNTALLNVTVMNKENGRTVPATVTARAHNLTGLSREIPLRETVANGYVSYSGAYSVVRNEVIDFEITARVADSPPVTLRFRDRMQRR